MATFLAHPDADPADLIDGDRSASAHAGLVALVRLLGRAAAAEWLVESGEANHPDQKQ
ncbi:MAG: hypothetical protein JOZ58_14860 [Acetobacteraceae bacterium]|nr:hypothetical protein [Acetobacteraceae bacterium]